MKQRIYLCAGMLVILGSAVSARADYLFTFNYASSGPSLSKSSSDQSTNIANYMDSIIGCSGCVTVSTGVAVAQEYDADGNVVGKNYNPLTLGNSDGATSNTVTPLSYTNNPDYYISNMATNSNGSNDNQLSQGITITLSKGYTFTGTFSFDYEIFPDITCTQLNSASCGGWNSTTGHYNNQPDLAFSANGSTPVSTTFWGVVPGGADGSTTTSPDSSNEKAPQWIGTSGNFTLNGATVITFMDWPAAIGVDNLKLVTTTPEPSGYAFMLGGLMLALLVGSKVRQGLAKSSS